MYVSISPSIKYGLSLLKTAESKMLIPHDQISVLDEWQMLNDPGNELKPEKTGTIKSKTKVSKDD